MQLVRSNSSSPKGYSAPAAGDYGVLLTAGSYRPDRQYADIRLPSYGRYDYWFRLSREETEYLISRLQGHLQSMEREEQKANENQHA